jgi:hypothetical protein
MSDGSIQLDRYYIVYIMTIALFFTVDQCRMYLLRSTFADYL